MDNGVLSRRGVKGLERDVDHPPPPNVERQEKLELYTATPPHIFMLLSQNTKNSKPLSGQVN
jgi:hypothetical protein